MTFGKFRGQDLADIEDESYLRWVLEKANALSPTLREAIRARLGLPPTPPNGQAIASVINKAHDVLRSVHREMALRYHPDRKGGSNTAMAAINHMNDCLQEAMSRNLPKPDGTINQQDPPF
jgi:hypothetical protein